jgi:hypothetical protein
MLEQSWAGRKYPPADFVVAASKGIPNESQSKTPAVLPSNSVRILDAGRSTPYEFSLEDLLTTLKNGQVCGGILIAQHFVREGVT